MSLQHQHPVRGIPWVERDLPLMAILPPPDLLEFESQQTSIALSFRHLGQEKKERKFVDKAIPHPWTVVLEITLGVAAIYGKDQQLHPLACLSLGHNTAIP